MSFRGCIKWLNVVCSSCIYRKRTVVLPVKNLACNCCLVRRLHRYHFDTCSLGLMRCISESLQLSTTRFDSFLGILVLVFSLLLSFFCFFLLLSFSCFVSVYSFRFFSFSFFHYRAFPFVYELVRPRIPIAG